MKRQETTIVERVIVSELILLLDCQQQQPQHALIKPCGDNDNTKCHMMQLPWDVMLRVHCLLTMTETLIVALTSRQFYRSFRPLFRDAVLQYRVLRPTHADYKVATIGRTVSYRLPSIKELQREARNQQQQQQQPSPTTRREHANTTAALQPSQRIVCFRCQKMGHITLDCPLACRRCGQRGHTEIRCPRRQHHS